MCLSLVVGSPALNTDLQMCLTRADAGQGSLPQPAADALPPWLEASPTAQTLLQGHCGTALSPSPGFCLHCLHFPASDKWRN